MLAGAVYKYNQPDGYILWVIGFSCFGRTSISVALRLYSSSRGGWISKLFWDDVIHTKIEAMTVQVISFLGFSSNAYQAFAANLTSLVHVFAILFQALVIALICFLLARWI